jgi:uncharacterized protein (TIGR02646 family)
MIRLQRPALVDAIPDAKVRAALAERRHGAASLRPRDAKITSRWDSFVGEKGRDRAVGHAVCAAVRAYCRAKCAYCEAPEAMTIDHVWPKSEHPARMFDWDNLLAACRDCNTSKRSSFPLDERGAPLLIDPTRVDPLDHFRWNHVTGECVHDPQDPRAHHTFQAFDLDRLKRERMEKLINLRFLLTQALGSVEDRSALHQRLRAELDADRPYLCIVRSYLLYPPNDRERRLVAAALAAIPDILLWVEPWLLPPANVVWPPLVGRETSC